MKVMALSAEWCGKCQQAKRKLKDYPIEWVDVDMDHRALNLGMEHNVTVLPSFIIYQDNGEVLVTTKVLAVKVMFDEYS